MAEKGGSDRLKITSSGTMSKPTQGARKSSTTGTSTSKGYSTTLTISVLRKLLALKQLRLGDGIMTVPESRVKERIMETGRLSLPKGVKIEDREA